MWAGLEFQTNMRSFTFESRKSIFFIITGGKEEKISRKENVELEKWGNFYQIVSILFLKRQGHVLRRGQGDEKIEDIGRSLMIKNGIKLNSCSSVSE